MMREREERPWLRKERGVESKRDSHGDRGPKFPGGKLRRTNYLRESRQLVSMVSELG